MQDSGPDTGKQEDGKPGHENPRGRRRWLPFAVFFLTLLLALVFHRCHEEPLPPSSTLPKPPVGTGPARPPEPAPPETIPAPPPKPVPVKPPKPKDTAAAPRVLAPVDSGPYLWADPWGGRHFDSVRVTLHCREGCLLLYSLEDSIHFKSYETPWRSTQHHPVDFRHRLAQPPGRTRARGIRD